MQTEMVDLNGQSFFLRRWGDPDLPPLLLLHGFPEYGGAWEDLAAYLSSHFHCIAPDQRGYGQSWAPGGVGNYTAQALVSDMAALIAREGRGPVAVFGHDWGAAVAYGLAMFQPALVSRLVIANGVHPAPFMRELARGGAQSEASQYINALRAEGSEDRLSADGFAGLMRLFSASMDLDWFTPEKQAAYQTEWARKGRLKAMINWYRASPLKVAAPGQPLNDLPKLDPKTLMVSCPHLLIWGMGDKALLPASNEGLEAFAPNLTRVTFDDADHWICHQIPEKVTNAVLDWMAG